MAEELLLSPEITVHEEPGHITIDSQDIVSVEVDDADLPPQVRHRQQHRQQLPFPNGDIPPEISITKVRNRQMGAMAAAQGFHQRSAGGHRPPLKVRSDLGGLPPSGAPFHAPPSPFYPPMGGDHGRMRPPPPLMSKGGAGGGGLPPMPRLKFGGGPRVQRPPPVTPLAGMMNMQQNMMPPQMARGSQGLRNYRHPRPPSNAMPPNPYFGNGSGYMPGPYSSAGNGQPSGPRMFQHRRHASGSSSTINVNTQDYMNKVSSSAGLPPLRSPSSSAYSLPPMVKPGAEKRAFPPPRSSPSHVRTVFVPPPMKMNYQQQQSAPKSAANNGFSAHQQRQQYLAQQAAVTQQMEEELEIDDDEEEAILDEEELDDVEPELDPKTAEVDDVEPSEQGGAGNSSALAALREQEALIRSIDKHQVTVSITPKSSIRPKQPTVPDSVSVTAVQASPSAASKVAHYARRPDGKGFIRKVMDDAAINLLRSKKKKKKKAFRGINYRFDGSRIKKRVVKRAIAQQQEQHHQQQQLEQQEERESTPQRDATFLEYLGIQRKDSTDSKVSLPDSGDAMRAPGQRAKKSFKVPSYQSSRAPSSDDTASVDSGVAGQKRRLSLSEVLNNQKKLRPSQQTVRHSFGGGAGAGSGVGVGSVPAKRQFSAAAAVDMRPVAAAAGVDVVNPPTCLCAADGEEVASPAVKKEAGDQQCCQAVESVGGKRVGCSNAVGDRQRRFRAAKGGKAALLCPDHVARLRGHNMCPFCSEFCAHGVFFMCRPNKKCPPHLFHKQCYLQQDKASRKCPHCESTEQPLIVQLKLLMSRVPLDLLQVTSKMTFPAGGQTRRARSRTDEILSRENLRSYALPDGKVISAEGLPRDMSDEALLAVIEAVQDKQAPSKHTTRNMYVPVKAGDNVKMLQMLSMGYSANQRLNECDGGTPLHVAAAEGHTLTMHILVQAGAELDAMNEEQNTALMIACIKGKSEAARYLLQAGADVTQIGDDGMTCLHLATQNGFLECTHVILSQSHLPKRFLNRQDEGGWTPLVWACENKHEPVIRYLLERGADPLITDVEGNIGLHWAALSGSRSTCELLLNAGCDVNATNSNGETPMHIALRQDHYECALLLLMRGARLDIRNKNALTPAECMVKGDDKLECRNLVRLSAILHDAMREGKHGRSERVVSNDVSRGKENAPIQVVNAVDDAGEPDGYVYVGKNCVTNAIPLDANISKLQHCKCGDTCASEDTCHCSDLSVRSWYDSQGQLKEDFDFKDPPMLFECNDMCGCHVSTCHNRVVQHGISVRLQVYRTDGMGWGVRALADIPRGAFVCEYVGEIISDSEADTREDSYLFDLDNRDGDTFCLDANKYGNIARFINHSCEPNVVPVKVFTHHQDLRFPHIALFASRDIPRGQELGFDYGEKFWVIKHRHFTCCCGREKCRYNRSSIQSFLKEYYERMGEPMPDDVKASTAANGSATANAAPPVPQQAKAVRVPAAAATVNAASLAKEAAAANAAEIQDEMLTGEEAEKLEAAAAAIPVAVKEDKPLVRKKAASEEEGGRSSSFSSSTAAAAAAVVKKEVSDDACSEDGGGQEWRSGRPRRAVTKKAAPAGDQEATSSK